MAKTRKGSGRKRQSRKMRRGTRRMRGGVYRHVAINPDAIFGLDKDRRDSWIQAKLTQQNPELKDLWVKAADAAKEITDDEAKSPYKLSGWNYDDAYLETLISKFNQFSEEKEIMEKRNERISFPPSSIPKPKYAKPPTAVGTATAAVPTFPQYPGYVYVKTGNQKQYPGLNGTLLPPGYILKPLPKPTSMKPSASAVKSPFANAKVGNIINMRPKNGPNNTKRPYIPMSNRVNKTMKSRLNENINAFGVLNSLQKFSSPTILKGKKSYFSRNQVKHELTRLKNQKAREQNEKAKQELENATKKVETELQELAKKPNNSTKKSFMNKLRSRYNTLKQTVNKYVKNTYKQYQNDERNRKLLLENEKWLEEKQLSKNPYYNAYNFRKIAKNMGRETQSLQQIYEELQASGFEDPLKHMRHLVVEDAAQVLGIPVELLDEILKDKGDIWLYSTDKTLLQELTKRALLRGEKGEAFVRDALAAIQEESAKAYEEYKRRQAAEQGNSGYQTASLGAQLLTGW